MMNIVKLQDQLKNFSQEQLISAMQMPDGSTPQYLVLGEIMRRKQMESSAAAQPAPESTVAEDAVAAAGVPQGGIADMARALAPKTDMAQNTGIQAMASGGPVKKMAAGERVTIGGGIFIEQADGSYLPATPGQRFSGVRPEAPPDPMLQAAEESANEAAALREEAGITEAFRTQEEALANAAAARESVDTTPAAPEPPPVAPQGGGGGGGGGMSPFEQQLMDALASREKAAKQDKWLSLAQVGLNLMSSKEPTLLGALGESGLKGVEAARAARDQYDKDKLDLQTALEQSRAARAAAAAKAAAGASAASAPREIKPVSATIISQYLDRLDATNTALSNLGPVPEAGWWSGTIDDPAAAERTRLENEARQLEDAIGYAYATQGMPYIGAGEDIDADLSD
jgi:hypothetical protein